jgi:hypothetical protein
MYIFFGKLTSPLYNRRTESGQMVELTHNRENVSCGQADWVLVKRDQKESDFMVRQLVNGMKKSKF